MCSFRFNLTLMFLNSFVTCFLGLMILFHLLVNCLRVVWIDCLYVCRVCFVCVSHQWCTVDIYCASAASEWPSFQRKKGFFLIFFKKMDSRHPAPMEPDPQHSTSRHPARCHHISDPGSQPPDEICVVRKQPQVESVISVKSGMLTPTQVAKKDYQRLVDEVSFRWWGLITPRKPRVLYHKILLGTFSSWDSRVHISDERPQRSVRGL